MSNYHFLLYLRGDGSRGPNALVRSLDFEACDDRAAIVQVQLAQSFVFVEGDYFVIRNESRVVYEEDFA